MMLVETFLCFSHSPHPQPTIVKVLFVHKYNTRFGPRGSAYKLRVELIRQVEPRAMGSGVEVQLSMGAACTAVHGYTAGRS